MGRHRLKCELRAAMVDSTKSLRNGLSSSVRVSSFFPIWKKSRLESRESALEKSLKINHQNLFPSYIGFKKI